MIGKASAAANSLGQLATLQRQIDVVLRVVNSLKQNFNPTSPNVEMDDFIRLNKFLCSLIDLTNQSMTIIINQSLGLDILQSFKTLNDITNFYIKYHNACRRRTEENVENRNQLRQALLEMYKHSRTLFEISKKSNRPNLKKSISQTTMHLCWVCEELAGLEARHLDLETSIRYASEAIEWSKYLSRESFDSNATLVLVNHKEPIKYDCDSYKKNTKQNIYNLLFRQALNRKASKQARWYFDRLLKHQTCVYDATIQSISALIELLIETKQYRHAYRYILEAKQYLGFEPMSAFTEFYQQRYTTWSKLLDGKIQQVNHLQFQEIRALIQTHNISNVSMIYNATEYDYFLQADDGTEIKDELIEKLKLITPDIERVTHNQIRIRNVITISAKSFVALCLQLDQALKSPQPTLPLLTQDSLVAHFEALLSHKPDQNENDANMEQQQQQQQQQQSDSPVTEAAKEKVKTRGKPNPRLIQSSSTQKLKPNKVITTHTFGFKLKEAKRNVVEIKGKTTPCDTYYAYWDQIENPSDKSDAEILHYKRDIFARGKVVSPGKQGYRPVFSNESGLDHMTFKLRDPSKDLGLLLIKDDEVVDERGQKRTLFRVGRAVYH